MGIQAKNPFENDDELDGTGVGGEPIDEAYDGGVEAAMFTEVDHIAMVVPDLGEAIAQHRDRFGILVDHREDLFDGDAEVAFLTVGGSSIALIAPNSDDSPYAEFLAEGGPGLHHIGYRVDDCAAALAALVASGVEPLDDEPQNGPRDSKVAFIHPDDAFGILIQLVQR